MNNIPMDNRRETYVVNLWGGPGCGKSTLAALVFAEMKKLDLEVELIREYIKPWAWRGHPVGRWDELYILGKQLRAESACYGKVDWIVTDRPLGLSAIYEKLFGLPPLAGPAVEELLRQQTKEYIFHVDLLVKRTKPYNPVGRYQSKDEALKVDELCRQRCLYAPEVASIEDVMGALGLVRNR